MAIGLAVLEHEGFAIQGRFTDPDARAEVEWCARRLLARMHSYSRSSRRKAVEAVTAVDFMRFLLRWQHVAPGTQLRGHGRACGSSSSSCRASRRPPPPGSRRSSAAGSSGYQPASSTGSATTAR